jgi:hypothetical protein
VAARLDALLGLGDLPNRTINVSQGPEALKGGVAPASSLQCWQDCMNRRAAAIEADLLNCLGFDSLGHAIGVALKACIIGAVTAAIAAGVLSGGTASLPAALAGCFIGIDLEYHYCVGEFICKLAWAGARCWWSC